MEHIVITTGTLVLGELALNQSERLTGFKYA